MFKSLLKPLGVTEFLKSGGTFEFITGDIADAPADWVAGYIQRMLSEDRRLEIVECWTEQDGLKDAFDKMYKGLRNPYTHVFNHKEARDEIFPML